MLQRARPMISSSLRSFQITLPQSPPTLVQSRAVPVLRLAWKPTGDKMEFNCCLLRNKRRSTFLLLPGMQKFRLRQAKEDAEKDIGDFSAHVEAEFQKRLHSGDSGANVKRLEQETDAKIVHLKTGATRISHDVVQMLLKHVMTMKN